MRAPAMAPTGSQLPKIMAASAIKPLPPVMKSSKVPVVSRLNQAPARPATAPPRITFR